MFSGLIRTTGGSPIAGARAQLERYVSGVWQPYYYKLTDASGRASLSVRPTVTMTMRLSMYATAAYIGCATGARTLWVSSDSRVIAEAARHNGKPYSYGASGPSSFDCSGYSQYVFRAFGRVLPRMTKDQYAAVHHISQSSKVSGDLIFFGTSTAGTYHLGIYAGGNYIWHAPAAGQTVRKQLIWTSAYYVGRL